MLFDKIWKGEVSLGEFYASFWSKPSNAEAPHWQIYKDHNETTFGRIRGRDMLHIQHLNKATFTFLKGAITRVLFFMLLICSAKWQENIQSISKSLKFCLDSMVASFKSPWHKWQSLVRRASQWRKCSIRFCCRQRCRTFLPLVIDVGGLSPFLLRTHLN